MTKIEALFPDVDPDHKRVTNMAPAQERTQRLGKKSNLSRVGSVTAAEAQGCCEAGDVGDDASADDQQGLVAAHGVLLHGHQDALHVLDALVHLIAAEHQLRELDVVGREVVADLSAIVLVDLVVHDSDASSQGLVHVEEQMVGRVQDLKQQQQTAETEFNQLVLAPEVCLCV